MADAAFDLEAAVFLGTLPSAARFASRAAFDAETMMTVMGDVCVVENRKKADDLKKEFLSGVGLSRIYRRGR